MKRAKVLCFGICVLAICLTSFMVYAEGAKYEKSLTVINLGGLDDSALSESVAYLTNNVPLPVHVASLSPQMSLETVFHSVAKARSENDAIVIAVVSLKKMDSMILADSDHAIAVINTEAVKKVSGSKKFLNQVFLRALAAELGVGYSLDPHCVNRRASSADEYEKLGGNFSPPTLQMVLFSARERGVKTILPFRRLPAPSVAK
jgi:hypothetical protein